MRMTMNYRDTEKKHSVGILFRWLTTLMVLAVILLLISRGRTKAEELLPIPDKLVVLTFDDAVKSQFTTAAPILKQYGFGATFFITEAFKYIKSWKNENYMTWDEIKKLHEMGFEIGNHTRRHSNVSSQTKEQFLDDLEYIEKRCKEHGIPVPKTFCYPGYQFSRAAVEVLAEKNYLFARRGYTPELSYKETGRIGLVYNPKEDHPLLIPTTAASGPTCGYKDLVCATQMAKDGKITVLPFHGVPDIDHPWVHTDPAVFEKFMKYLYDNGYTVIAMHELVRYVDLTKSPANPLEPIKQRLKGE